jgi:hypothetical protein
MTRAIELVHKITALGGRIRVEDGFLVVSPREAVMPFIDELRRHKPELLALLQPPATVPPADPDAWREPFVQWLDSSCLADPRCSGGLNALHRHYCDWELAHDGVPCTRDTFVALLVECGFRLMDSRGTALVEGLAFCEDADGNFTGPPWAPVEGADRRRE